MMTHELISALDGESAKIYDARALRERVDAAFESGDYEIVRQLDRRIVELVPDSDLGRQAAQDLRRLSVDPVHIYSGIFAAFLFLIGWLTSFQ